MLFEKEVFGLEILPALASSPVLWFLGDLFRVGRSPHSGLGHASFSGSKSRNEATADGPVVIEHEFTGDHALFFSSFASFASLASPRLAQRMLLSTWRVASWNQFQVVGKVA